MLNMNAAQTVFEGQRLHGVWRDEADRSVWAEIFDHQEYRAAEERLKGARVIFDIGAHAGFFALYARALNPKAKIVCVEPEQNNIDAIRDHLKKNNKQVGVLIIEGALASKSGTYGLMVARDSHNHQVTSMDKAPKGARQVQGFTLKELIKEASVDCVDLLKMDIEGAEMDIVLKWGQQDFALIKSLILEYHGGPSSAARLRGILKKNGFGVQVFPSKFDAKMGILFARKK